MGKLVEVSFVTVVPEEFSSLKDKFEEKFIMYSSPMQMEGRGNVVRPKTFLELQSETALWPTR